MMKWAGDARRGPLQKADLTTTKSKPATLEPKVAAPGGPNGRK